jgi:transketolase
MTESATGGKAQRRNREESAMNPRARSGEADWDRIDRMAWGIRRRVLAHVLARGGGYLSQACSSAEIFAALYGHVLRLKKLDRPLRAGRFEGTPGPGRPAVTGAAFNGGGDPECDNFVLSPAQYALVLYAALVEAGRMDEKSLEAYDEDASVVEVIGAEHSPGMEATTGSLGQGISQASGIAMARKILGEPGRVVLLMSDGECQSGEFWEAVQAACFHKLGNMLVYVDMNGFQCDGEMASVMRIEPLDKRLRAFGALASRIDGHDVKKLARPGQKRYRASAPDVPSFYLCGTDPCRGMDILKSRYPKFHYVRFSSPDEKAAYQSFYDSLPESGAVSWK